MGQVAKGVVCIDTKRRQGSPIALKDGVDEILNLQPKGSKSKSYQVKQVRNVILKYKLGVLNDE